MTTDGPWLRFKRKCRQIGAEASASNHRSSNADWTPVCPKSLPFQSIGSRRSIASAYERQSPKFNPARWPLPLPKSA